MDIIYFKKIINLNLKKNILEFKYFFNNKDKIVNLHFTSLK